MGGTWEQDKLELHTNFWSNNLKGHEHLEDVIVAGRVMLQWILRE